ncbi:putative flavin monooxygenase, FAD/NAD(P)-binding domain superfamily [Helianthus anomalus]
MECQSRWIAHALSAKVSLPSENDMLSEVLKHYEEMKEKGLPEHSTHQIGFQDYIERLWAQTGMIMEKNIKDMIEYLIHCLMTAGIDGYMDLFSQKYGM